MVHDTHRWARALAVGGVLLALGGCAAGQPAQTPAEDAGGTETQAAATSQSFDGGSMSWKGKELTVELEANPTTGYDWEVMVTGSGLEFTDSGQQDADDSASGEEIADDQSEGSEAVGAPVIETFTFTGTAKGAQTITLTYKRPWEATDSDKVLTIEVTTGEDGAIETAEGVMMSGAEAAASGADANTSAESGMATGADDEALKDAGAGTDADVPNE